jgi:hypothetical protein
LFDKLPTSVYNNFRVNARTKRGADTAYSIIVAVPIKREEKKGHYMKKSPPPPRVLLGLSLAAALAVLACDPQDKDTDGGIPPASIGTAFTVTEDVYNIDTGGVNTALTIPAPGVEAKVNGHTIATGEIREGRLTIAIPAVPEAHLHLYATQDTPVTVSVNPNTVKTGTLELTFRYEETVYKLAKGVYSSLYEMIGEQMDYVFADKEAVITGNYTQTLGPMTVSADLSAHLLSGWNVLDNKMRISITDESINAAMTSKTTIPSGYKWYITVNE